MGRDTESGSENFGKIAQIAVAYGQCCLSDVVPSSAQKAFGQMEAVVTQVINGGVPVNLFEASVKFTSAHSCCRRKGRNVRRVDRIPEQEF